MQYGANIDDLLSPLKQRLHMLEEENQKLKMQLHQARAEVAELKSGQGITVLVGGKPVATGTNIPPEVLPTRTPAPGYGRAFATPAILHDHRPPDVVPLPHAPGNYPATARGSQEAPASNGRNGELAKHFLED
ncbi:MAG: hypothetical protein H0X24_06865 [Ktedonobacterales bacterium]|nr:hypothetical protein [Ktedonobacterales bacterium]